MKKSTVISVLKQLLTKYNTGTPFYSETSHAKEVLFTLEELGILNPTYKVLVVRRDIEGMPYEEEVTVKGWEVE